MQPRWGCRHYRLYRRSRGEPDGLRYDVCKPLAFLGVEIDAEKNKARGEEIEISTPASRVKVCVIPTDEELMIARDTEALVKK